MLATATALVVLRGSAHFGFAQWATAHAPSEGNRKLDETPGGAASACRICGAGCEVKFDQVDPWDLEDLQGLKPAGSPQI